MTVVIVYWRTLDWRVHRLEMPRRMIPIFEGVGWQVIDIQEKDEADG